MKKIETTEKKKRFMLWLPESMVRDVKVYCTEQDITYSRYIHDLVEADFVALRAKEDSVK